MPPSGAFLGDPGSANIRANLEPTYRSDTQETITTAGRALNSRPIETSTSNSSIPDADFQQCEQCGRVESTNAFCNVCKITFCERCWSAQFIHRQTAKVVDRAPHEKTDFLLAMKVRDVLLPAESDAIQEQLYREDEDTAWFGRRLRLYVFLRSRLISLRCCSR